MLLIALTSIVLSAGEPIILWLNASELDTGTVAVPRTAAYVVHVWAPVDTAVSITIAGQMFEAPATKQERVAYTWVRAGKMELQEGSVPVAFGEGVAAAALCTDDGFEPAAAQTDMRVYDEPKAVNDRRATTARHTDTVYMMPHYRDLDEWEAFAARLRRRTLLSSGLLPLPERTPLNAKIFDRVQHDDYSVEKVHFEARPGFLVTGNLYRPVGPGPFPGVVCPHGHWEHGRLEDGERGSVPGRCITLARMGCVVFSYDMIGYNDSLQFKHNWGVPREKLWGLHPFAMQLWSSIRAVDFVSELPEVDKERIACTGASGGGTQTFALCAVDPRVKVAAPVNMISSTMQGGCLCENAPIIRLDNSNMEIGALMAPRPLLMVSATGDWTKETPRVEYPAIRSIYALYNAAGRVATVQVDAEHNYNQASREAVYRFFGKWLIGGDGWDGYTEPPFTVEPVDKLRVFPDGEAPSGYPTSDEIIAQTIAATRAKWDSILPDNAEAVPEFRTQFGPVLADVIGASTPDVNELECERTGLVLRDDYALERWILRRTAAGDAVPALLYRGYEETPQDAVLVVHGEGKAALADQQRGGPGPLVAGLIAQGKAVLCIDAFLLGDHQSPLERTKRHVAGRFMDTFEPTDTGCRIQDVMTALAFLRARRDLTGRIDLVGIGDGGVWCLFASAMDGDVARTVVDLNGFDPEDDEAWVERFYIPCIRSIGDVRTAAALIAPRALSVFRAEGALRLVGAQSILEVAAPQSILKKLE